jgi:hypothetical protein
MNRKRDIMSAMHAYCDSLSKGQKDRLMSFAEFEHKIEKLLKEHHASLVHNELQAAQLRMLAGQLARMPESHGLSVDIALPAPDKPPLWAGIDPAVPKVTITAAQALITLGKVIAGYRPGDPMWSKHDDTAWQAALIGQEPARKINQFKEA